MAERAAASAAPPGTATARLSAGLAAADEAAFREFHALYFDRLYGFLLVVCRGSDDLAKEALQSTLLRVVRSARVFEDEEVFWCWLKALARSAARDAGRKQGRYAAMLQRFTAWWGIEKGAEPSAPDSGPLAGQVEELLSGLEPIDRQLIEGKYLVGESVKDLAVQTRLTEKAVEARLARLRERLRERLRTGNSIEL